MAFLLHYEKMLMIFLGGRKKRFIQKGVILRMTEKEKKDVSFEKSHDLLCPQSGCLKGFSLEEFFLN